MNLKTFERKYSANGKEIIKAFKKLEQYSRRPEELLGEFIVLERRLETLEAHNLPRRLKDAMESYAERLKVNRDRGLSAQINPGDLKISFTFEFSELDTSPSPSGPDNVGRRVYTGQTEFPGSNPGYGPRYIR